ncbi:tRNA lysidine(34) synthetase TilS [Halobacillus fulvus]|nr:tRNA lysidine(34) synthetase TilS [Halobacillus fulvus]
MDYTVHSFMKKHDMIQPGQTVLVAVSGGPDSMALLHFLKGLEEEFDLRILVASVDHGLRGEESSADLAYVREICSEWEIEFFGTFVDVHSYKEHTGAGTQEAARHLRYQFFQKVMEQQAADVLAMGHHGDDQAETMMMQWARSARPEAVQGIPAKRAFATGQIIRPFLSVSKQDIVDYNERHRLSPRIDPSNEETDYTRNAFRKHVLPFFKEQNPKFHQHMQAMSERLKEERSYIQKAAEDVLESVDFGSNSDKFAQFSIRTFKTFPLALQRTAFHLILNYLYVNQTDEVSFLHEEMFFHLMNDSKPNAELHFPRGLLVVRAYDTLSFTFSQDEDLSYEYELSVGESMQLPNGDRISADWAEDGVEEDPYTFVCESCHVPQPFIVRTRRKGDRMRLKGMNGSKKVKDIFIDQKIPARLRQSWPMLTDKDGNILWLIGLKKAGKNTGESSGPLIRFHYENKADM